MEYDKMLSTAVQSLKPSGIRKYFDLVANSEGIITLGVGEPDFVTPEKICKEAIASINRGETYYTSNWGQPELRQAISHYLKDRFDLDYSPEDEILVTTGTSEALDIAFRSILNPGDEVLVPSIGYVAYEPGVVLAGGVPVLVDINMDTHFKMTKEAIAEKITDKTKAILIPYPANPTGAIMTREEMMDIIDVIKDNNLVVISDELYGELTYGGRKHVSIASLPGMRERTLVINGLSKAFAMTGWRVGYICGPRELVKGPYQIHQYTMLSAPIMAQVAARVALEECIPEMEEMVATYEKRARILVDGLNAMGLTAFEPEGAFYIFPSVKETGLTGEEFADRLLEEAEVAVVPGIGFGEDGKYNLRLCYAYSIEEIEEALRRMEKFVKGL